jgi:hypothetical protein
MFCTKHLPLDRHPTRDVNFPILATKDRHRPKRTVSKFILALPISESEDVRDRRKLSSSRSKNYGRTVGKRTGMRRKPDRHLR